jgi:ABC-type dipeptide/oligopeptide/nickel transport system ATPase component
MNVIVERIKNRLHNQNKNFLMIICGATGSGKSYSALRLAELIDPEFTIDNLVFSVEDFMSLLTSGKLKKGNVIVFDEAGVGIPAREWFSLSNKAINYVFQTFRHENLCVIFTCPSFDFIDSQTRKLFHAYLETLAIDFKREQVICKYMEIEYNPRYGKEYFKYPRAKLGNQSVVLNRIRINKPSQHLIEAYEQKKKHFTSALKQDVLKDIKFAKLKEEVKKVKIDPTELAKQVLANSDKYVKITKTNRIYADWYRIRMDFRVSEPIAKQVKRLVEDELRKRE